MKQKCLILWILLCFACSSNTSEIKRIRSNQNIKRDYRLIIDSVFNQFLARKVVSLEELEKAIPTTDEEFGIYYSYTYPKKGKSINQIFYKINNEFIKNAKDNKADFLKLFLDLSSFVDGEYAEGYDDDIASIISKNQVTFCDIYAKLSSSSKEYLEEYHLKYCK